MTGSFNIILREVLTSINADSRCLGQEAERPCAADAVPRKLLTRPFALTFVAFQESGHEEFFCKRREPSAASFTIANNLVHIVEVDYFDDSPRLRRVVANLVTLGGGDRFRAS